MVRLLNTKLARRFRRIRAVALIAQAIFGNLKAENDDYLNTEAGDRLNYDG